MIYAKVNTLKDDTIYLKNEIPDDYGVFLARDIILEPNEVFTHCSKI